ncbi:MAG: prepilin peptidase [Hespellia sp.]|nr:prepilin peptidase [Hespellia sp.]
MTELYIYMVLFGVLIFFAGSCIFSFLNVIVYRVPRQMSFVKGFSICPTCGHQLGALDLVPIWSYVFLKGKCRYCKTSIGSRDTWIEAFGGCAALFCAWQYRMNILQGVTVFLFLCVMTVVTFMDIDTMEIANGCWMFTLLLAIMSFFAFPEITLVQRLIGMICISVPMLLLTMLVSGAFGGGDIKLMFACGAFLGWKLTLVSSLLGILFGGIYGIYLLAAKKKDKKEHFAFGPFLCLGMTIGWFYGMQIFDWYTGFLI